MNNFVIKRCICQTKIVMYLLLKLKEHETTDIKRVSTFDILICTIKMVWHSLVQEEGVEHSHNGTYIQIFVLKL